MKTRSQTKQVIIDFDEASNSWMANKVRRGAMVYYLCTATQKSGKPCTRISSNEETAQNPLALQLCTQHARYSNQDQQQKPQSSVDGNACAESASSP